MAFFSACGTIAASSQQLSLQEEYKLEKFYGAKYVHVSNAEHERLVRGAIRAQQTGICNVHNIRLQKKEVPIYFGLVVLDDHIIPQS